MTELEKPQYLYRGLTINYKILQDFKFYGYDIVPYYEPLIDEYGRKTVEDGNEYGIYMTDYKNMAYNAYGRVRSQGTIIKKGVTYGKTQEGVKIPNIGLVYKINTDGMDVHIPWIKTQLQGHYNNGFIGNEWITERIPAQNYEIEHIMIGDDALHDEEVIDTTDIKTAEQVLRQKIEQRKARLEILVQELEKLPERKRNLLRNDDMQILKELFGENGVAYLDMQDINVATGKDCIRYLTAVFYNQNKEQIDFEPLSRIKKIDLKIQENTIENVIALIQEEIQKVQNSRQNFINRNIEAGQPYDTINFDKSELLFQKFLVELYKKIGNNVMPEELKRNNR